MDEFRNLMVSRGADFDPALETVDDFLGGAVRLIQPKSGYRISMDTVLLAAAVPAKTGQRVIEAGVGTGGAALCLARRVPGVKVDGIDIQQQMIDLARRNTGFNQLDEYVSINLGRVEELNGDGSKYDHAMINPPYLMDGHGLRPPEENKGKAHMDHAGDLSDWIRFTLHHVKARGTITIVQRADRVDEIISHLYKSAGDITIYPLWPRQGVDAKRVIVQAKKGSKGRPRLASGLILHGEKERYSAACERILWHGDALNL